MKVAIIGATGAVGREMISELEESSVEEIELELYASRKSAGIGIEFRKKTYFVKSFKVSEASKNQYILMSAGGKFSKEHSEALVEAGAVIINNSSTWRMHENVPLIVPEVNKSELQGFKSGIIANPNCSTIQMVVPLKALEDRFGVETVNVTTFQSVSGSGQQGLSELTQQIEAQYKFQEPPVNLYPQQIAFNVLSSIGAIDSEGHCEEEIKMVKETNKILNRNDLQIFATTARVPVLNCHCESVLVKCRDKVTLKDVERLFSDYDGLVFENSPDASNHPTPTTVAGDGRIFVTRLRMPYGETESHWLQFWVVADNLKKGAATNAVQIFESLVRK